MILPSVLAVTIVWDKKRGVFQRTLVGGAGLPHIFLAAIWLNSLLFVVQAALVLVVLFWLSIPFQGSVVNFLIICYGQTWIGVVFGKYRNIFGEDA